MHIIKEKKKRKFNQEGQWFHLIKEETGEYTIGYYPLDKTGEVISTEELITFETDNYLCRFDSFSLAEEAFVHATDPTITPHKAKRRIDKLIQKEL